MSSSGSRGGRRRAWCPAVAFIALILAAALCLYPPTVAGAQAVEDWDGVTEPAYDSAETDAANRDISDAQADRDAAIEQQDELGCSLCAARGDLDDEIEAAEQATRESVAELVDARAQAIEDAEGSSEEALNDKLDALDTLEGYADEWGPSRDTGGLADPERVQAAKETVGAELSAVNDESGGSSEGSGASSPEETTSGQEQTTTESAAPPPDEPAGGQGGGGNGSGGGDDPGGGPENPSGDGLLSGLSLTRLFSLIAAALIAIGISYFFVGLVREGIGKSIKGVGSNQQARASKPKPKGNPRSDGPKSGAEGGTRQHRAAGGEPGVPEREAPEQSSSKSQETSTKSPERPAPDSEDLHGDAGAIADRFKQNRPEKPDSHHTSAEELDELFFQDPDGEDDDQEDEDGR